MGREVSYEDAVKLLGGDAAQIAKLVDTLTGAGLLALLGPFRDVLGWFDAKAELAKVTERLVTSLAEKRSKLSRYERTERLQAAHAALALTAFFEARPRPTGRSPTATWNSPPTNRGPWAVSMTVPWPAGVRRYPARPSRMRSSAPA
ncbi:NACHT N-terminal helical domain 7-containing protein [Paractinoplanes toevensis]|uniref:NACHT N-terminal Helical domain-containing protein n=1 Tax=Paractinoplanes toevensis TaxID=571911 RepID=A0A919T7Z0_9ACTN|nr:hypothetical protein [Actinoplanes toevensis]GIM89246.1 hypothetical protein Ato02nite_010390 [Actinoplanes toevensis]